MTGAVISGATVNSSTSCRLPLLTNVFQSLSSPFHAVKASLLWLIVCPSFNCTSNPITLFASGVALIISQGILVWIIYPSPFGTYEESSTPSTDLPNVPSGISLKLMSFSSYLSLFFSFPPSIYRSMQSPL